MEKDELIAMAVSAGIIPWTKHEYVGGNNFSASDEGLDGDLASLIQFAKLVVEHERKRYMQLFLDPENQPTQFGTATQEYREQEIAEVRDLLFALAHRIRTTHLYGMEVQKMLEQAEAIRARGQA